VDGSDTLKRFIFERFPVRGHFVRLDASWRALIEHHDYPDVIRAALGESAAATLLLAATVKFDGRLTLQLQGPGPMHLLVVQAHPGYSLRAVARWKGELPPTGSTLPELSGGGQIIVTIENEDRTSRYQGVVPVEAPHLVNSFEDYFERSEQLPTRLWLVANETCCAGLLLQRLPMGASASSETSDTVLAEADEDWNRILHLAGTLTAEELAHLPADELLRRLFHEEDVRVFDPAPVSFRCACSRERVDSIIRSLGEAESRDVLAEQGAVEIKCEFCNRAWRYDAVDIGALFSVAPDADSPRALH
jgi:molecular chaperone Hsp33